MSGRTTSNWAAPGPLLDQAFGGKKAKVAYVMGISGTSPQILRAKGWDRLRAPKIRNTRKWRG